MCSRFARFHEQSVSTPKRGSLVEKRGYPLPWDETLFVMATLWKHARVSVAHSHRTPKLERGNVALHDSPPDCSGLVASTYRGVSGSPATRKGDAPLMTVKASSAVPHYFTRRATRNQASINFTTIREALQVTANVKIHTYGDTFCTCQE